MLSHLLLWSCLQSKSLEMIDSRFLHTFAANTGTISAGTSDQLNDYCSARGRAKFIADWLPGGGTIARDLWGRRVADPLTPRPYPNLGGHPSAGGQALVSSGLFEIVGAGGAPLVLSRATRLWVPYPSRFWKGGNHESQNDSGAGSGGPAAAQVRKSSARADQSFLSPNNLFC